jgi:hypothetical protein
MSRASDGWLQEGKTLDVADGAADLDDGDVRRAIGKTTRLISSVMWGITCTVRPENHRGGSLSITV